MADYEVSKIMWVAIVVALAASIFVIAKPQISTLAGTAFDNVENVVKGIDTGNGNNNGGDETSKPGGINTVPGGGHTPESDVNKPGEPVETDPAKYVESGETGFGTSDNGRWGIDSKGNMYIWSADDKPVTINVSGAGSGEFWNTRANQDDIKSITFATTTKIDTTDTKSLAAATFGNTKASVINVASVDTTGVEDFNNTFATNMNLEYIDGIENWNTSSILDVIDGGTTSGYNQMFSGVGPKLKSLSSLSSAWKPSAEALKNSPDMFGGQKYTELPSWATDEQKAASQNSMW